MEISLSQAELADYVMAQIATFFPDKRLYKDEFGKHLDEILHRIELCFSKVNSKYFFDGTNVRFDYLNADQYAMFLYYASNTLFRNHSDLNLATKIFQLNRYLHGIDVYYEVELPKIFLFVHPLGTVLGRAKYSDYLLVYQDCNIGGSPDSKGYLHYPECGTHLTMHPGSRILGNCKIADNCTMSAGSLLLNMSLESNNLYIGNPRDYTIKPRNSFHYAWNLER